MDKYFIVDYLPNGIVKVGKFADARGALYTIHFIAKSDLAKLQIVENFAKI